MTPRMTEATLIEDELQSLLDEAVKEWVVENPYTLTDLVHQYSSTDNPFLETAETKWFAATRGELFERIDDPLGTAAFIWVHAHPTSLGEEYSTSGNKFLWAAEGAFFDFLRSGRQRWRPTAQIAGPTTRKAPIPDSLRWEIWERDNFTCQHCGARSHLSVDHIIPESKGGSLDPANLQTLCRRCNSRKGASWPAT